MSAASPHEDRVTNLHYFVTVHRVHHNFIVSTFDGEASGDFAVTNDVIDVLVIEELCDLSFGFTEEQFAGDLE